MSEENKALVRRLVDEFINGGKLELVEELFAPELVGPVRQADTSFRGSSPSSVGSALAVLRCGECVT